MKKQNIPLILIIDDEEAILKTLKDALTDEDYHVETLSEGQKALERIGALVPDLILLDIFMPNCNGLALLGQIKKEYPDQKVIIISGFGNVPTAIEAIKKGAIDFIEKPLNFDEILNKIDFLKSPTTQTYNPATYETDRPLLRQCHIVGQSNLFLELIEQAERLAPHSLPVLIYGEHGTGRTALAHYIHKKRGANHKAKPSAKAQPSMKTQPSIFETINCEALLENELQASFANLEKIPKETSLTLYLKQVGSLSEEGQKITLSFLQKIKTAQSSIHIIASSQSSLFQRVQDGRFNPSLFFLLNQAPLEVPPLRKRPYDIPLLVNHFLMQYNNQHGKKIILTTQSIRLLRNHFWPGNVIDLKQTIENLVLKAKDRYEVVTPETLRSHMGEKSVELIEEQSLLRFTSLEEATTAFKKNFLLYVLKKNQYNINQVSSRLNVSPLELKNELLELKIEIPTQS